jgi:hypothetical protein
LTSKKSRRNTKQADVKNPKKVWQIISKEQHTSKDERQETTAEKEREHLENKKR